nr:small ubiquitin-related modifier 3 isoform X6 [Pelodiscus sinensis]|eukprot:XP_025041655.1 small ubiquitin-related modifier 3 isoform X6 [Pelodiscus sinensis]
MSYPKDEVPPQTSPFSDSREGVKTENDHINLKVAGQDGSVVQFKIKRHTPLSKLMKAYCERQLEMEDEDTIDVFQQQTGGVC